MAGFDDNFSYQRLFSFTYLIIVLNWGLHVHSARVRVLEPVWTWPMLATFGAFGLYLSSGPILQLALLKASIVLYLCR